MLQLLVSVLMRQKNVSVTLRYGGKLSKLTILSMHIYRSIRARNVNRFNETVE